MKTSLVVFHKKVTTKLLKEIKRDTVYPNVVVFTQQIVAPVETLAKYKKIHVKEIPTKGSLLRALNQLVAEHPKTVFHPYFRGDANSKYAIALHNKVHGNKIQPKLFKLKNEMNKFLGEAAHKHSLRVSYQELAGKSYKDLEQEIGSTFILKPTNASASTLNFKITNERQYETARAKLKKKFTYLLEEYVGGNLYSMDFYMDGEEAYMISYAREISFSELLERFSPKYKEKYYDILSDDFMHFLPIRYSLSFDTLTKLEADFLKGIIARLKDISYRGFIHVEYKRKKSEGKIGFIEWGARLGGNRAHFIEKMYNVLPENLPYEITHQKDTSRFKKKHGLNVLGNHQKNVNFVGIKTNVFTKTHIMKLLQTIPDFLNHSFEDFLRDYLWDNWKIKFKTVTFAINTSSNHYIYPFYERSDTKFDYLLKLDADNYQKFVKKKEQILEHLVFHDYK